MLREFRDGDIAEPHAQQQESSPAQHSDCEMVSELLLSMLSTHLTVPSAACIPATETVEFAMPMGGDLASSGLLAVNRVLEQDPDLNKSCIRDVDKFMNVSEKSAALLGG